MEKSTTNITQVTNQSQETKQLFQVSVTTWCLKLLPHKISATEMFLSFHAHELEIGDHPHKGVLQQKQEERRLKRFERIYFGLIMILVLKFFLQILLLVRK